MIVKNPPAVPADVVVQSSDPFIAAVEWACILAGVTYHLPAGGSALNHIYDSNSVEMSHVLLPDLGLSLEVLPGTPKPPRPRQETEPMVVDGESGIRQLAAFLGSLKRAPT